VRRRLCDAESEAVILKIRIFSTSRLKKNSRKVLTRRWMRKYANLRKQMTCRFSVSSLKTPEPARPEKPPSITANQKPQAKKNLLCSSALFCGQFLSINLLSIDHLWHTFSSLSLTSRKPDNQIRFWGKQHRWEWRICQTISSPEN